MNQDCVTTSRQCHCCGQHKPPLNLFLVTEDEFTNTPSYGVMRTMRNRQRYEETVGFWLCTNCYNVFTENEETVRQLYVSVERLAAATVNYMDSIINKKERGG